MIAQRPDPDFAATEYVRGFGDGCTYGRQREREDRRSPLLGFVIVAVASAIVAGLITAAAVHAAAPRPVSAPPVPAQGRTGAPSDARVAPSWVAEARAGIAIARSSGAPSIPASGASPEAASLSSAGQTAGFATWYRDPSKPIDGLYGAVPGWHYGDQPYALRVTAGSRSVVVLIGDCLCGGIAGRVVDLSASAFSRLAPLSAGVVSVRIERVAVGLATPPPTDVR